MTVARQLLDEGPNEVLFVGTARGTEARLVPEAGCDFVSLPARGFDRSRPWTAITAGLTAVGGAFRALGVVRRFRPDVVVGFGGYVSMPVGLAAIVSRVPLVLHEQNSVLGLANRTLARWAKAVALTYPVTSAALRGAGEVVVTGNPVRRSVLDARREDGRKALEVPEGALLLLVFGGSRGARHLNETVVAMYPRLKEVDGLHVVHVAGSAEHESVRSTLASLGGSADSRYRVVDYLDGMGEAIAAADLVVARAGATSIAEITVLGRPAVLVPYPYATDDHQTRNARAVMAGGAAVVVADADLDGPMFPEAVLGLVHDEDRREAMARASAVLGRPEAGRKLAELVARTAGAA